MNIICCDVKTLWKHTPLYIHHCFTLPCYGKYWWYISLSPFFNDALQSAFSVLGTSLKYNYENVLIEMAAFNTLSRRLHALM